VKSATPGPVGQNGAMLSISSDGNKEAIIWATHAVAPGDAQHVVSDGILRAVNAANTLQEIWNSNLSPSDNLGKYAKFATPTIVNGRVYVATFSNNVKVYGLK
jgi:outer membrane protein assembly factor BamB